MKPHEKECKHPTCGATCRRPKKQRKFYQMPKQKSPIKKVAESSKPKLNTYRKESKIFREENTECKVNSPVCIGVTQCVHHTKGKIGALLNDKRWWMPSCFPCNGYVEDHSEWAKENNKKFSKF